MTVGEALEAVLKRVIEERQYYYWDDRHLTLDFQIDITPEEAEALQTLGSGDGWHIKISKED